MLVFALAPTLFKRFQRHRSAEALFAIQVVVGQAKMARVLQFSRHAWVTSVARELKQGSITMLTRRLSGVDNSSLVCHLDQR